jgi:cyanate permease
MAYRLLGWRLAFLSLAGIAGVLGVLIGGYFLTYNRPEDKGQFPDGVQPDVYTDFKKNDNPAPATSPPIGSILLQLLKSPIIWFVGGFAGINTFTMGVIMTHQVSYVQDIGFSAITAATTISVLSCMIFVGSLTFGAMAMKINMRILALGGFIIMLLAMVLLITSRNLTLIYLYAAMIGLGNGALTTAMPTFISNRFHGPAYSQAFGFIMVMQVISHSTGTYVAGAIYDATSSYSIVFYLVAGLIALGTLMVMFSKAAKSPGH